MKGFYVKCNVGLKWINSLCLTRIFKQKANLTSFLNLKIFSLKQLVYLINITNISNELEFKLTN